MTKKKRFARKQVLFIIAAAACISASLLLIQIAFARELFVLSEQQAAYVEEVKEFLGDPESCEAAGGYTTRDGDAVLMYNEDLEIVVFAASGDCHSDPYYVDMAYLGDFPIDGDSVSRYIVTDKNYGIFTFDASGPWSVCVSRESTGSFAPAIAAYYDDITVSQNTYLSSNSYVDFTSDTYYCQAAEKIAEQTGGDWNETAVAIQNFVVDSITYDDEIAAGNYPGRWSDLDEVYVSGKGICTDYASAMAAMLRHVGIPAKFACGYVSGDMVSNGGGIHAWVEVLSGDGKSWIRFDPTFYDSLGMNYSSVPIEYDTYWTM